jgi:hypothetical protein
MKSVLQIITELIVINLTAVILLPLIEYTFTCKFLTINKATWPMYSGTVLLLTVMHLIYTYTGVYSLFCK